MTVKRAWISKFLATNLAGYGWFVSKTSHCCRLRGNASIWQHVSSLRHAYS